MKRTPWIAGVAIIAALVAGYAIRALVEPAPSAIESTTPGKEGSWTCSMHPQVRLPKPGKCPICGMPLIPTKSSQSGADASAVTLSDSARALARIETQPLERRKLAKEIRAVGKVQFNETALATVTARVDGYVERLFVDYVGMVVEKGSHLAEIYSPELVVAQREFLLALADPSNPSRLEAAKLKFRRWEVPEERIEELARTRHIQERVTLHATVQGTVIEKKVVEKSPIKAGDMLFQVADLRSVWVYLNIYEYEIGWVQYGQTVALSAEAFPGETFRGLVTFISPVLDEETRSIRVRVNVANLDRRLKPGMFASARMEVGLLADGRPAPTGVEGKYNCPMHPEVLADGPGTCPLCGMEMKKIPGVPGKPAAEATLAVPVSAVLDSGTRRLVYVDRGSEGIVPVEVTLGPKAGDFYAVSAGLKEGDRVVVRGNFLLDSQFQIQGLPSLLHSKGTAPATGHEGHGATPGSKPQGQPEGHPH